MRTIWYVNGTRWIVMRTTVDDVYEHACEGLNLKPIVPCAIGWLKR